MSPKKTCYILITKNPTISPAELALKGSSVAPPDHTRSATSTARPRRSTQVHPTTTLSTTVNRQRRSDIPQETDCEDETETEKEGTDDKDEDGDNEDDKENENADEDEDYEEDEDEVGRDTTVYRVIRFKERIHCTEWFRFPGPREPANIIL